MQIFRPPPLRCVGGGRKKRRWHKPRHLSSTRVARPQDSHTEPPMAEYFDQPTADQLIEAIRSAKASKLAIAITRENVHRASGLHPAQIDECENLAESLIAALQSLHNNLRPAPRPRS